MGPNGMEMKPKPLCSLWTVVLPSDHDGMMIRSHLNKQGAKKGTCYKDLAPKEVKLACVGVVVKVGSRYIRKHSS